MAAMALKTKAIGLPNWAAPLDDGAVVADGVVNLEVDKLLEDVLVVLLEVEVLVTLLDMDDRTA
jgi:hypothetical protein